MAAEFSLREIVTLNLAKSANSRKILRMPIIFG